MLRTLFMTALLTVPFIPASAMALTAQQIVEREVVVKNPDGSETVRREKADMVVPGETVIYSLNYMNERPENAENVVLVMPIPSQVTFREGSADAKHVNTTFSTDGGTTFASRKKLKVRTEGGNFRAARSEDLTHIKWVVTGTIKPGDVGSLSFAGTLQ